MAKIVPDYDADCDVLYITVGAPTRDALSFEDEAGLIWRQSPKGECLGLTVPDFKFCWGGREAELAELLSAHLHTPVRAQIFDYA